MKTFLCVIGVGSLVLSAAFAQTAPQTVQIAGTVVSVTPRALTVQKANEPKWVWEIRTEPKSTTVIGEAKIGSQVMVTCIVPDAQKKEAPNTVPTPTPAGQ
jgi:hypothetical protein